MIDPSWYVEKPQLPFEALQLTWENWGDMCDFITVDGFRGVYLDEKGVPLEDHDGVTDTMGALIPGKYGEVYVAKEGDYVARVEEDEYYVVTEEDFLADFVAA